MRHLAAFELQHAGRFSFDVFLEIAASGFGRRDDFGLRAAVADQRSDTLKAPNLRFAAAK